MRLGSLRIALLFAGVAASAWAQTPGVDVSGPNSVGIGTITNSTVQIGITQEEAAKLATATGKELVAQMQIVLQKVNAQLAKANQQAVSIGVVNAFLATVKGKQIPEKDWPQAFGELTRQYLQLGERIGAVPVTSEAIEKLVEDANAARKQGRLAEADSLLGKASDFAIADARKKQEQALASNRQAASLLAARASVAFAQLDWTKGAALLEQAFDQRKNDVSLDTVIWLQQAGDAWMTAGKSAPALRLYRRLRDVASGELQADPDDTQWQYGLAGSEERIGDVLVVQGDLPGALKHYETELEIVQKLAAADPSNAEWQYGLAASEQRIGYVLGEQGDLAGALKHYETELEIAQKLAAADPDDTRWQYGLVASEERVGYVLVAQGDLAGALKHYQAGVATAQKLTAADPGNAEWQYGQAVCERRVGHVLMAQGDLVGALKHYQAALATAQKLTAADPSNARWQRGLAFSYLKIGGLDFSGNPVTNQIEAIAKGLAILEKLQKEGRLTPVDAGLIEEFRQKLRKLENS